jgi:molybdopterin synthase catalytic subunit
MTMVNVKITEAPISAAALASRVRSDADGAIVSFEGVVRDHNAGKGVCYLEYEAYAEMAEREMAIIGSEAMREYGATNVAIVHRVGRLEVGEVSIAIAVAAPHRREAFAACAYTIDAVKRRVPIWKKEQYADGEQWLGAQAEDKGNPALPVFGGQPTN